MLPITTIARENTNDSL